jgi:hypothetical protein
MLRATKIRLWLDLSVQILFFYPSAAQDLSKSKC